MSPVAIIIWVVLLGAVAAVYLQKCRGRQKYKVVKFTFDPGWLEHSAEKYHADTQPKGYFFHYDKAFLNQGHVLEDEGHNVVYEVKFLYNNGFDADEVDFVNHIINLTHHHRVGKTVSTGAGMGHTEVCVKSSFSFDGEDVFGFLNRSGYDYRFSIRGLAYRIDIMRDGAPVGCIYSSNNGKNLYDRGAEPIKAKAGGKGLLVLECTYRDLDALILYAVAFTRTDFDMTMLGR